MIEKQIRELLNSLSQMDEKNRIVIIENIVKEFNELTILSNFKNTAK